MTDLGWAERESLKARIQSFIRATCPIEYLDDDKRRQVHVPDPAWVSAEFEQLALKIAENQAARSPFLRQFHRMASSQSLRTLEDIPAVPAAAFRGRQIIPISQPRSIFHTSGTTGAETGIHAFVDTDLYDLAAPITFGELVLGKHADRQAYRFINLLPPPSDAPYSSLVHMMRVVADTYSQGHAEWLAQPGPIIPNDAPIRLDDLLQADATGHTPVILSGPAFAFVQLIERAGISPDQPVAGPRWTLPPGSRIMETGGFKGRTREIRRDDFHRLLATLIGIPESSIINEYGMTELSSQFYDRTLVTGINTPEKTSSPWLRAWPVHPLTGQRCEPGQVGLLRIADLCNLDSAIVIQTEDQAVAGLDGSFTLLGRVPKAKIRGCSLPFERA
jgi:hypothetical protein